MEIISGRGFRLVFDLLIEMDQVLIVVACQTLYLLVHMLNWMKLELKIKEVIHV
jgi:hypothetical protein